MSSETGGIIRFGKRAPSAAAALKSVPADFALRQELRQAAAQAAGGLNGCLPALGELEKLARRVLERLSQPQDYLGFAMVMLANAWWQPHCARFRRISVCCFCRAASNCLPPTVQKKHLKLVNCAAARNWRATACSSPMVRRRWCGRWLKEPSRASSAWPAWTAWRRSARRSGRLGLPAVAVPLLQETCQDTSLDLPWLQEFVMEYEPSSAAASVANPPWLSQLSWAAALFEEDRLKSLLACAEPTGRSAALKETAEISRQWLAAGGKRLRPFITLAAAAAVRGGACTSIDELPRAAQLTAVAVEAFHKASLAHDDIEDDDQERYGQPTLHRRFGRAAAINIGDYLLGLGYRLLCAAGRELPLIAAQELVAHMSRAHVLLAQGQGAELAWRRNGNPAPTSAELLRCYSLKTAPAFAAALACGVCLGGENALEQSSLETFSRHVGVGFQLQNDLTDWQDDVLAGRATYLTALAAERAADDNARTQVAALLRSAAGNQQNLAQVRDALERLGVFATVESLVERLRERAHQTCTQIAPARLGSLCQLLTELVLA